MCVALILLLGGIESNPGPGVLKLGVLNVHSGLKKAPLIHDVIADHKLDLLVATETWLLADHPPAITEDIAPAVTPFSTTSGRPTCLEAESL